MRVPISTRLDADLHAEREAQARDARKARTREESAAVGAFVAASPAARAFYEDWGTPDPDGG